MKPSDFLALATLKRSTVEVGGQTIHVRELSVGERAKFMSFADKNAALSPAFLVQTCVVNEDGSQVFSEADAKAIADASPEVIDKVATVVMEISRMREEDTPNA